MTRNNDKKNFKLKFGIKLPSLSKMTFYDELDKSHQQDLAIQE